MKRQDGFTLIELTLVVGIFLLLITILYPYLLAARRTANESAAVANLKALASAETAYATRNGQNYAGTLASLSTAGYIDQRFGAALPITGYLFQNGNTVGADIPSPVSLTPPGGFAYSAAPNTANEGAYNYAVASDFVVRYGSSAPQGLGGQPVR